MIPTARRLALAAVALLAPSTTPAGDGGPVSPNGRYAGGEYVIEVPAGWNGGLVLYAHGFRGTLASHLADRGYALAASSYRAEGYRVDCQPLYPSGLFRRHDRRALVVNGGELTTTRLTPCRTLIPPRCPYGYLHRVRPDPVVGPGMHARRHPPPWRSRR